MENSGKAPAVEQLHSSDDSDVDEDLWGSPSKPKLQPPPANTQSRKLEGSHGKQDAHEEALRKELQSMRKVNDAIEDAIESLAKAKDSIKTVNTTVSAASSLLSTWTKILSQTEHNQRLILNPSWQGASRDLADAEEEALAKQQAIERREYEEQERRAAAARKGEDDDRRRAEAAARVPRGTSRSRGRGLGRGGGANQPSTMSYGAVGRQGGAQATARGSSTVRRTTSGIGRGVGSVKGRSRG